MRASNATKNWGLQEAEMDIEYESDGQYMKIRVVLFGIVVVMVLIVDLLCHLTVSYSAFVPF